MLPAKGQRPVADRCSNGFLLYQAPNTSAARLIFSTDGTPKGHRCSQAPQATHSPALCSSTA